MPKTSTVHFKNMFAFYHTHLQLPVLSYQTSSQGASMENVVHAIVKEGLAIVREGILVTITIKYNLENKHLEVVMVSLPVVTHSHG